MTIASETSRVNLVGDGVNDTFTYTFEIYVKTDLLVYVDNVLQEVDVEYTIADAAIENPDGGDIVFGAGDIPALDAVVSIILNLPYTQLIDYVEASKFPAETHERGLDRLIKIAQQLKEHIARQPVLLDSSQYSDLTLPDPVANEYLAWKADLSGLKNVILASEGDLTVTDFIKTLLDDEDAAAFLTTLGIDTDILTLALPADVTISAFVKTLLDDADAETARATLGLPLYQKVVEIGDWNMDTTGGVNVAHGLTLANIRSISVLIRNDDDTNYYPLDYNGGADINAGAFVAAAANINCIRTGAGLFDNNAYDATTYNRGWITIWYVE